MAMDFFEHQEQARRKTGRLVLMFIAAVIGIIAMVYLVVAIAYLYLNGQPSHAQGGGPTLWNPVLLLVVGTAVIVIVSMSSFVKISQLSAGGRVVAESLNGRLLDGGTNDPDERKLLNVVEEMAIASGVPVPDVYVMDREQGINAFAAGFSKDDAVIGVTRGCMQLLNRDELQGVIAHEFSHILNGDMRLNIRLIGVLFGILVIGLIGRMVLSNMYYAGGGRSRSSSKDNGSAALAILGVALALMVIGFVGYFFGSLIKAAVSRQREFLADASAVQFTRYPDGIAGALKKIGGYSYGSKVTDPHADEVSHMFFGQGVTSWMGGMGATHPPLDQRIRRIQPSWDGRYTEPEPSKTSSMAKPRDTQASREAVRKRAMVALAAMGAGAAIDVAQHIGRPTEAHVDQARQIIDDIPDGVKQAAQSSLGACAVIYGLLISQDEAIRQKQEALIRESAEPTSVAEALRLYKHVREMERSAWLPALDLAMPALHNLSAKQYEAFKRCVLGLIQADGRMDLFEWMLGKVMLNRLAPVFEPGKRRRARAKYYALRPVLQPLTVLMSTLAHFGSREYESAQKAYETGMRYLPFEPKPAMLDAEACGLHELDGALEQLKLIGPREMRAVINACAACIKSDREVTISEAELFRAVCDSLGCPMPPIVVGQV